jgi:hypothetical protein
MKYIVSIILLLFPTLIQASNAVHEEVLKYIVLQDKREFEKKAEKLLKDDLSGKIQRFTIYWNTLRCLPGEYQWEQPPPIPAIGVCVVNGGAFQIRVAFAIIKRQDGNSISVLDMSIE